MLISQLLEGVRVPVKKKIAIVTDSNSGLTQEQGKELGVYVLPMPFVIDGNTYFEDINLSQEEFYQHLHDDVAISTSQPAAGDVLDLWDRLLEEYETVIHIPMSSGLSGSCASAKMLAMDYEDRVFVVDNQRISITQRQSVLDARHLASQGMEAAQIARKLEETRFESSIYIMLDTLYYLKKGGRVTPAAAAIATVLKLKPVLQIQGEKLDAFSKARSVKQARSIMIDAIKKDFETRFGGMDNAMKRMSIQIAHTQNEEAALAFREEVQQVFPGKDIYIDSLSLSVSCHIGPGSLALATAIEL